MSIVCSHITTAKIQKKIKRKKKLIKRELSCFLGGDSKGSAQIGVHNDGDGAVIAQRHLHVGAEDACLHLAAEELLQAGHKALVHRHRELRPQGLSMVSIPPC